MKEQQQFGGGAAGGVGREQPVELVGLVADFIAVPGDARDIVAGPALGAAGGDDAAAVDLFWKLLDEYLAEAKQDAAASHTGTNGASN